ncbi:Ig-like domain-containing protein [Ruminococcus bromii]|uniref:Ig-like domain-containing protein n=1 Tax=Ruminococcus bromii TaxID=40518 RepID=UPI003A915130
MKAKRIMPLLLSAIMTVGTATAVPFTASAVETNAPVVSAQSAKTSLATPKISKAESINGGVKISWGKVNGAEKYRIYYKGSKGWTRMVDTTSTSYIDKDVSSGKTYTYTVRCINSSATKFTSGYNGKGKSIKYIAAPEISKLESVNGGVKISWNKSNGAEKYRIYYKGSKGWTRMVDTTSTSYIDKDVSSGKNYTYTVRCINSSATKFTSGYDSKGKSVKYISAPKITKAESVDGGVKISWNKSNGAEKYRVYYKSRKGWTRMVDTTSTSYIDNKVSSGKTYTYTVRCINSSANKFTSGYDSKGVTVTTPVKPSVKLNRTSLTLTKGKTYTLKTTVTGTNKAVSWSSSNSSVASVDKNGKVTAKTKGTATITVKVDGVSASCKVTVNEPAKTTIKLDKTKVTLGAGEPCTLKATVSPSQKVTWTSSNPKLVKVDSNGKLTVTKDIFNYFEVEQTVKITAKAGNATATCTVTTNYERVYHKYAIVPVYKEEQFSVCKGCGRLIDYTVTPGTKYETEDGRKGVFITKEEHNDHSHQHVLENKPGGWYSEVVMLKVGERVQREGWYVD